VYQNRSNAESASTDGRAAELSTSTTEDVVALRRLHRGDGARFGGKAAMLGMMLDTGVPVLDGLAVAVSVYSETLRRCGAEDIAATFWRTPGNLVTTEDRLERLSAEILQRILRTPIDATAISVLRQLRGHAGDWSELLVRSSATVEDSTHLSYAGQFESVRCTANTASLCEAICRVWTSCTVPNVRLYRDLHSYISETPRDERPVEMGLVVQPYRTFSMSGVLFTQHPTVRIRNWMLLEYLDTQPAQIVAGEVQPHRCRASDRNRAVVWEHRVAGRPVLGARDLADLVEGGNSLRAAVGADVDIEWGITESGPYFLQCRPATTSPWEASRVSRSG
jgi:phosphoenolpyruvate synthase/pyruvate phosphate dikinase